MTEQTPMAKAIKKIFIYGLTGTGKTASLATLAKAYPEGKFHLLAAENNSIIGLQQGFEIHNVSAEDQKRFSVMVAKADDTGKGASALLASAKDVLLKDPVLLLKTADTSRKKYKRFLSVIQGLDNFVDTAGVDHGSCYDWDDKHVLAVDSATIIARMIRQNVAGGRMQLTMSQWMPIQNLFIAYIEELTEKLNCHVIVIGHPVRAESEISKTESIYPATPGQAIKDLIPPMFTDVIYAERVKKDYFWHTQHAIAQCSARNMPSKNKMTPTYEHISW